jgi:hypothetical protein
MAYFSNGTEGMILDDQCAECIHADEDGCCPVFFVQMEFNYSQLNGGNEDLKKAMEMLIDKKGNCNVKKAIDNMSKINGKVNPKKKCFQRPLVFGDEEQIAALND